MTVMTAGSVGEYAADRPTRRAIEKGVYDDSCADRKKSSRDRLESGQPAWLRDMKRQEEKNKSDLRVSAITGKLNRGGDLTPSEMAYLRKNNPAMYERAAIAQRKKAYLRRKLSQCRSRRDVKNVGLEAAAISSAAGSAAMRLSSCDAGSPGSSGEWVMSGVNNTYNSFLRSADYARLPYSEKKKAHRLDARA